MASSPPLNVLFLCTGNSARSILVEGSEEKQRKAFFTAYNQLFHRLMIFVNLPLEKLGRSALKQRLDDIGQK